MKNLEHQNQCALFTWAKINERKYPALELMFAVPNGGHRHIAVARKLKAEGVKAGVPDIFLPWPTRQGSGLFIEMKVGKNKVTPAQQEWLDRLSNAGYKIALCYGWEQAKNVIEEYLNG